MGTQFLHEVKINNVDVTSKTIRWKITKTKGHEIMSCEIELSKNIDTIATLAAAQTITIKRGVSSSTDQFKFNGEIVTIDETGYNYKIGGADKLYDTVKNEVATVFDINISAEAGQGSEIFKTLINDYTNLTADNTSVQATGTSTSEKLTRFKCRHEDVFDKLKELCSIYGYQMYYDATTNLVYFEPDGYTMASVALTIGGNVTNRPKWKTNNLQLCNSVDIIGAVQDVETTLPVKELDVTTGWTSGSSGEGILTDKPVSIKVWADAADPPTTLRVGGVEGGTSAYDYKVDFENSKIKWSDSNGYDWNANHHVLVWFTYSIPVPVAAYDQDSIDTYGLFKRTFSPKQIDNIEDAEIEANRILDKYKNPFKSTVLTAMNVYDLDAGQTVQVTDTQNSINKMFVINKIEWSYPFKGDKVTVGDREIITADFEVDVAAKIQEFEQMFSGDTDYLVLIIKSTFTPSFKRKKLQIPNEFINDTFYLNHPVNGLLDQGRYLDDFESGFSADWSGSGFTIAENSNTNYIQTNDGSCKLSFSSAATHTITSTQSFGNVSEFTGENSGTPSKGTAGIWMKGYESSAVVLDSSISFWNDLLFYYKLDETSGVSMSDSSGNGYSSTLRNGALPNQDGILGRCVYFNGGNDYMNSDNNIAISSTDFTYFGWIKTTDPDWIVMVKLPDVGAGRGYALSHSSSGTLNFGNGNGFRAGTVTNHVDGGWHFICGVHSESFGAGFDRIKVYVDGVEATSYTTAGAYESPNIAANKFEAGAYRQGTSSCINGYFDNCGVVEKALSEAEVQEIYKTTSDLLNFNDVKLRLGSGASDYIECTGKEYGSSITYTITADFADRWNYILFDLDSPDSVVGTPDWTSCNYARIAITTTILIGDIYADAFTISKSDFIGWNMLNIRTTPHNEITVNY